MMIVGIDGYIFDVFGFYFVDYYNNDVVIIKYLLFINESVKNWFLENDIFIVDRGFWDVVEFLEEEGFNVKMLFYFKKGLK